MSPIRQSFFPFSAAVFCALSAGCAVLPPPDSAESTAPGGDCCAERLAVGKIFVLDGVGGTRVAAVVVRDAFRAAGIEHAIEEFYWGHGWGRWHDDLTDIEWLRRHAALLVERIRAYRREHPGRPVHIVAASGGTAPAVFAVELLAADERITAVHLIAPALSPEYDLTTALARTDGGINSFSSPLDWVVLGLGTTIFGTADGRHTPAAGMVGFRAPVDDPVKLEAYTRLRQFVWTPDLIGQANLGGHFVVFASPFLEKSVAPRLIEAEVMRGAGSSD